MNTPALTSIPQQLRQAWRLSWKLYKQRDVPLWAQLCVPLSIALLVGLALSVAGLANRHQLGDVRAWTWALFENLVIAGCVSLVIFAGYRALERLLPESTLDRINADRGWRAALLHAGLNLVLVVLGFFIGLSLLGTLLQIDLWTRLLNKPAVLQEFLLTSLVATTAASLIFWWRERRQAEALRATEAQFKALQAQIEPHFLFNTLAHVHCLMDEEPLRAKQMLESFTDYLRSSLGQLRREDGKLGEELDLAQAYLQLMQTRMDQRLRFEIEVDPTLRGTPMPPLLLQPLLENAIHHGLEPKAEGGCLRIHARHQDGRLDICVEDDGLGLEAAARRPRRGSNGIALDNIRARLQSRYGQAARLSLEPRPQGGTMARLNLPLYRA
jgi:signal transduction histidine kinase